MTVGRCSETGKGLVLGCTCMRASPREADEAAAPGPSPRCSHYLAPGGPERGRASAAGVVARCTQGREALFRGPAHTGLQPHRVDVTRHLRLLGRPAPALIKVSITGSQVTCAHIAVCRVPGGIQKALSLSPSRLEDRTKNGQT